jgi:acyl-CoA thioesterase-2
MSAYTTDMLIEMLDLEQIEQNIYRGLSPDSSYQRTFGGQVIGQALMAAYKTVDEDRVCHSLHSYFIRPGDPSVPILYQVERTRDGRSFSSRRVTAVQHGKTIFDLTASFQQKDQGGLEFQSTAPTGWPSPDELRSEIDIRRDAIDVLRLSPDSSFVSPRPIDWRPIDPIDYQNIKNKPPEHSIWMKAEGSLGDWVDDIAMNQCVLAFASDYAILEACVRVKGLNWLNKQLRSASLDHSMWFHRPFRVEEWLMNQQECISLSDSRGFAAGKIYTASGELIASVAQEGMIRLLP